jgi:RNA polymerase sigma-70 factor (ECF subfamily)
LKTAVRVHLDHRRRRSRAPEELGDRAEHLLAAPLVDPEARDLVENLLQRLSPIERTVVLAFHRDARSLREIAQSLDMPLGTVKSHLHRARIKLARGGSPR